MHPTRWVGMVLAASFSLGGLGSQQSVSQAVEVNGQVYFERPPLLTDTATTRYTAAVWNPTYYFTLTLPEEAGEPLGQVAFQQKDSSTAIRLVEYEVEETRAFVGTRDDRGEELAVAETDFDRDTQTVTVTFAEPVPPGTTVTIGLKAERNPRLAGVYLFGVTAYPAGEPAYGQFLGYGRLHIYDRNDNYIFY